MNKIVPVSGAVIEPNASWSELKPFTPARIALGRAGVSLPTRELLAFELAHARARDAVHDALDVSALRSDLESDGWSVLEAASSAKDRAAYLARPDWGRKLDEASREQLRTAAEASKQAGAADLMLVLSDGLSSAAIHRHARALLQALKPHLSQLHVAPVVIATQARVALADEIGAMFGARLVATLIGERPGLSSPDSLGIYLTADPKVGRSDAERNCISNIHAAGLGYDEAASQLAMLIGASLKLGLTGVALAKRLSLPVPGSATNPE